MAREKKLIIGALNIKLQPHSPEKYIELFEKAFQVEEPIKVYGDRYGTIGSLFPKDGENMLSGINGLIYKFINFDPKGSWFNFKKRKEADKDEINSVNIPDGLKPTYDSIMYTFYPKGHRLFFAIYDEGKRVISPNGMKNFFNNLFSTQDIEKEFGEVDVIIEPAVDQLEKILNIKRLEKLEIFITRPNPDDHGDEEQRILDKLNQQKAKNLSYNLTSIKNESLSPDEETLLLSRVAVSNGYVYGSGKDEMGKSVHESTEKHPLEKSVWYDSLESPRMAFEIESQRLLRSLV